MAQHFLLSSKAKTLSLVQVMNLTNEDAFKLFKSIRWGNTEEIPCPRCGTVHKPYFINSRKQWRCKHCDYSFSITSGTIFSNHKLPLKTILLAIVIFTNAVKGISSLQLSRDLGVNYRTAFKLAHKIRESLKPDNKKLLNGNVQIDGCYVHTSTKPSNKKSNRIDRRKVQNPNKRCILVICNESTTSTFIINSENENSVLKLVKENVSNEATITTDENPAYNILHGYFNVKRINHSQMYSDNGTHTNYAESFFSRFRRMQIGQIHKLSNKYLSTYTSECSYREDMRNVSNGIIVNDILSKCFNTKPSKVWCGY